KDPFAAFGESVTTKSPVYGLIMRFSGGKYCWGATEIPLGSDFIAGMDLTYIGSVRWINKRPDAYAMARVASGLKPPKRKTLGDLDRALWPKGRNGEPEDVWQFAVYLPLMSKEGQPYTFVTQSRGGIGVTGELARRYAEHRKNNPNVFPLIRLNSREYDHPEHGTVITPVFDPVGYLPKDKFYEALKDAGIENTMPDVINTLDDDGTIADGEPEPPPEPKPKSRRDDMDDEIPF